MATPGIPGFEEISNLATKYSPEQLQRMAASGMIDVSMAMRAKFLQQRIASDVVKAQAPTTTVAQDVMAPPQPMAPQGLPAAQQMAAAPTASGLDALPVNEAEYAGGGIVAFAEGGTPYDREMVGTGEFGDIDEIMASIDTNAAGRKFKEQQAAWDALKNRGVYAVGRETVPPSTATMPELDADPLGAGEIPEPKTPKESVADAAKQVKEAKKTVDKAEDYLDRLKKAGVSEDPDKADREEIARLRGEAAKDRDQAAAMAMIKAGLGIAGGKSQYALQNVGQGAQSAVTDYAKALRDIKSDEKEYAKIERDLNKAADARKRGDVEAAVKLEEAAKDREIRLRGVEAQERQATKPTQFQEMYAAYAADEKAAGRKPTFEGFRKAYGAQDENSQINQARYGISAINELLLGMKKDNPEYAKLVAQRNVLLQRLAGTGGTGVTSGGAKFVGFE